MPLIANTLKRKHNISAVLKIHRTSLKYAQQNQVISHKDLNPKNIIWKNNKPYIIDWEAAGFINPFQELIEVLNYWIPDKTGKYDKAKFNAIIQAYTENIKLHNINWDVY